MLPRVKIYFQNGNLGQQATSADGVLGLIGSGVAIAGKFELNKAYVLYSMDDLAALGITATTNAALYKLVSDFYNNATAGTEVWLMGFPDTLLVSDIVDKDKENAKLLINAANGRLRGLVVSRTPDESYEPTITDGLDADVALAATNAQALAEWATETKFSPLFVILEGYGYAGDPSELADLSEGQNNRVGIFIGDTVIGSQNATMGTIAGRIASIPVQRNIGRVKDGAIASITGFIADKAVEVADAETLNAKRYITLRTFVGRSGYFFSDDPLATAATDDYSNLSYRRTIDKAYRVAYDTLLPLLLDEVPVNSDGTIQLPYARSWEAAVEDAIVSQMTANGELSADADNGDSGVVCAIDTTVNLVAGNPFKVLIQVRPFGYARLVDVYLGFQTIS